MEMEEGNNQGQGQPRQRAARTTTIPRRSGVYEHFTDVRGDEKVWRCKHCHEVVGANIEKGTSNLWKHLKKKCKAWDHSSSSLPQPQLQLQPSGSGLGQSLDREPAAAGPEEDEAMPQLQPSGPGEPSDGEPAGPEKVDEASKDLARMVALHGYNPSVVEDEYFRSFVRHLNPGFELPSRKAVEKMCSGIFGDFRRDRYRSNKEDDPPKVSVAVGQSKTIETGQVVYLTAHFIDSNWNLHRGVDDVRMALPVGDHYHVPLRPVPVVSLDDDAVDSIIEYGGMIDQNELFMIAGESTGHISHRNVKGCMEKEGLVTNIYSATYMDHVLHSIARCLLPDSKFVENIFNVIYTFQHLVSFKQDEILTKYGLLDDPWEHDERWYSCYYSLELLGHTFTNVDSECTVLLRTLWRAIYRAIKRVSDSSRPTSNICLQELFNVRDVFKSELLKAPPDAACPGNDYSGFGDKNAADVLREALETVDKAIQDSYLVWSIPLVLDPRCKLRSMETYFKKAFGLSEAEKYVSEVRRAIKELYNRYNGDDDEDSDGSTEEMSVDSSTHSEEALDEQCRSQDNSRAEAEKELDDYLQDSLARATENFDILNWWKVYGSVQYPTVARMARDALAMPTCSKLNPDQMAQV